MYESGAFSELQPVQLLSLDASKDKMRKYDSDESKTDSDEPPNNSSVLQNYDNLPRYFDNFGNSC